MKPAPGASADTTRVGTLLRHALGLTAWKAYGLTRWSLRANPSSGNLHPTEAYIVAAAPLVPASGVWHYAPDRHALEQRCACDVPLDAGTILVALTSIHWRESWKYGERAFRYCQHDLGHAIAAVRIAASLVGWTAALGPEWSHAEIASLTGVDRVDDYRDVEREEPGCIIEVTSNRSRASSESRATSNQTLLDAVRGGVWTGRPNLLSHDHVQWSFIDEAARATEWAGRAGGLRGAAASASLAEARSVGARAEAGEAGEAGGTGSRQPVPPYPAETLLRRRSAVAFDGRSSIGVDRLLAMLERTLPDAGAPWDAVWWSARIHLVLFVHRVDGLDPGLYLLPREPESGARLVAAFGREFTAEPVGDRIPLVRLGPGDCRRLARRVSCDQDIAADGFFSLGMIADFDKSLAEYGPSFYRHLFWESGIVGQVLYLEAEAAGARATGIGCFYDDPVHDLLGLTGHAFQSLYHFSMGVPIEDTRLTTENGYHWER